MLRCARMFFVLFLCAAMPAACAYGNRVGDESIAGPLGALSLAHVEPHTIAVLAGSEDEKTVSVFYDVPYGAEIARFPVSPFSTSLRGIGNGELLISIAPPQDKGGAIETWTTSGTRLSVMPAPAPVLGISRVQGGVAYALVRTKTRRYALPIDLQRGGIGAPLPVESDTSSVDACRFNGRTYVLTGSAKSRKIGLVDSVTGERIDTGMLGESPTCLSAPPAILALQHSPFARRIDVLHLSRTAQRANSLVAPADGIAMAAASDGTVFILRITGSDSQVEIWHPREFMAR